MSLTVKKLYLAAVCVLCRAVSAVLRVLGRGGTSLPGRLALKLCPDILTQLSDGVSTVLVTGTNGKTTTCELLRHIALRLDGPSISNTSGANMLGGIAAAFACGVRPLSRHGTRLAVIECDEAALCSAAKALHPKVIAVTNIFRDQLDRYGEVTVTRSKILSGILAAPEAILCLNADCSLTASLSSQAPNRAVFFGLDTAMSDSTAAVSDAPRCLFCGGAYVYDRHTFAHLGDWRCPDCGRSRPVPETAVTDAAPTPDGSARVTVRVADGSVSLTTALGADYNLYNLASVLAVAGTMGWDVNAAAEALPEVSAPFGRGEALRVGNTPVRLFLAKNPAGMDRLLEWLSRQTEPLFPVFCLNDNYADGRDVSWIWDADFESVAERLEASGAGVWGTRRHDMLLRLKYASQAENAVSVSEYEKLSQLRRHIATSPVPVCIIANYTSMLAVRKALTGRSIRRSKWS